ncbi:MAG: SufE family protein [bacterium]
MERLPDTISELPVRERQKRFIYLLDDMESSLEIMKYLISLGRSQVPFTEEECARGRIFEECSITVRYLFMRQNDGSTYIRVNSDSQVLQGVLAVFAEIYQGSRAAEIRATKPEFHNYLPQGLVPSFERKNGLRRLYFRLLEAAGGW